MQNVWFTTLTSPCVFVRKTTGATIRPTSSLPARLSSPTCRTSVLQDDFTLGTGHMGFSIVTGIPLYRWMVYFMENPNLKWMIWGYPYFRKPPYSCSMFDSIRVYPQCFCPGGVGFRWGLKVTIWMVKSCMSHTILVILTAELRTSIGDLQQHALYIHTYIHTSIHPYIHTCISNLCWNETSTPQKVGLDDDFGKWTHLAVS
jgi:hypothetical protein